MKLSCGHIRPGKVLTVEDNYGTIKGSCAGLFSVEDSPEKLPPIYPFLKMSPTQFVKPNVGDDIWVLFFTDNPQELFYVFQGSTQNTAKLDKTTGSLEEYDNNVQILMACESGFNGAELSFSTQDGWKLSNDSVEMTMKDDNTFALKNDNGELQMNDSGICLSGSDHSVARGDVVMDRFSKLESMLKLFAKSLNGNPYTASAGAVLENLVDSYMTNFDEIESPNVYTK